MPLRTFSVLAYVRLPGGSEVKNPPANIGAAGSASLGSIVGDNTAITNLPNHTHQTSASTVSNTNAWFSFRGVSPGSTRGAYGPGSWTAASVGGGGSHENRMRSKYVVRWIRVA